MKRVVTHLLPALLVVILVAMAGLWWYHLEHANRAPEFALKDLEGQLHHMRDWHGKVVLLNFWAPWCVPCRKEIPMLVKLQQQLAAQGLQVVGLSVDRTENVRAFTQRYPINYPVLVGLNAILQLQDRYGETRLPYTVIIDRDGRIHDRHLGELERATLMLRLRPLLQEH